MGEDPGTLFPSPALVGSSSSSEAEIPPAVSRRVLDLVTYLARHLVDVALDLATLEVPSPRAQSHQIAMLQVRNIPFPRHLKDLTMVCSNCSQMAPIL